MSLHNDLYTVLCKIIVFPISNMQPKFFYFEFVLHWNFIKNMLYYQNYYQFIFFGGKIYV